MERLSSELGFVDVLSASRHYKELGSTAKKNGACLLASSSGLPPGLTTRTSSKAFGSL